MKIEIKTVLEEKIEGIANEKGLIGFCLSLQAFYLVKLINTPGMIRTCDLLIRSQALYPAELRVRKCEYLDYKSYAFLSSPRNVSSSGSLKSKSNYRPGSFGH